MNKLTPERRQEIRNHIVGAGCFADQSGWTISYLVVSANLPGTPDGPFVLLEPLAVSNNIWSEEWRNLVAFYSHHIRKSLQYGGKHSLSLKAVKAELDKAKTCGVDMKRYYEMRRRMFEASIAFNRANGVDTADEQASLDYLAGLSVGAS